MSEHEVRKNVRKGYAKIAQQNTSVLRAHVHLLHP